MLDCRDQKIIRAATATNLLAPTFLLCGSLQRFGSPVYFADWYPLQRCLAPASSLPGPSRTTRATWRSPALCRNRIGYSRPGLFMVSALSLAMVFSNHLRFKVRSRATEQQLTDFAEGARLFIDVNIEPNAQQWQGNPEPIDTTIESDHLSLHRAWVAPGSRAGRGSSAAPRNPRLVAAAGPAP